MGWGGRGTEGRQEGGKASQRRGAKMGSELNMGENMGSAEVVEGK